MQHIDSIPIGKSPFTDPAVAKLLSEMEVRQLFPQIFKATESNPAYPDQLHTFVGDCSSTSQVVAMVPQGDVLFTDNKIDGECLISVLGERVSADYIDFLEQMQISYIFAGLNGTDKEMMRQRLAHDFGILKLRPY